MKKIIILMCLTNFSYATSLMNFEKDNIKIDKEVLKIEKNKIKNKLGSFYAPKITPSLTYNYNKQHNLNADISISYGWFNYGIGINLKDKQIINNNISMSMPINTYLYNYIKENNINYEIEKNIALNKDVETIENIFNLYAKYVLKKYEKEIIENEMYKLNKDNEVIEKQYERGLISKNDYKAFKDNLEINKLSLEITKDELSLVELEIKEKDIDISNIPNFDFNILTDEEIKVKALKDFEIQNLEIEKKEIENSKYLTNNILPNMSLSANYDISSKDYGVSFTISKNIDFSQNEISTLNEMKKEVNNLNNKKEIIKEKTLRIKNNEYSKLKLSYFSTLKNLENMNKDLETVELKYRQGNESFIKLFEKRKELKQLKLNLKNIEIQLAIYEWKVKRGE